MEGKLDGMMKLGGLVVLALPAAVFGQQAPLPLVQAPSESQAITSAIEIHVISNGLQGVVLKHAGVDPSSVVVSLGGRTLKSGSDYSVNGPSGIISIQTAVHPGDTVTVTYRYGPAFEKGSVPGSNLLSFNLGPAGKGISLGLGLMTPERLADGSVYQSQTLGLATNFKSGGFGLAGSFLVGNRMSGNAIGASSDSSLGKTERFLQETLSHSLSGGVISLGYQDISSDFKAFDNLQGYTADQVGALRKEAGLKQQSLGLTGIKLGGGAELNSTVKSIHDGTKGITTASAGLKSKNVDLNFSQDSISSGFARFDDLSDASRGDWKKQAGMNVRQLGGTFRFGKGSLDFANRNYHGSSGDLNVTELSLKHGGLAIGAGSSSETAAFSQFRGLSGADRAAYKTHAGVGSKWFSLSQDAGKGIKPLVIDFSQLNAGGSSMRSTGLGFGGKNWDFQNRSISSDAAFGHLNSLTAAQQDADIKQLSDLMDGASKANVGAERGAFTGLAGISRSFSQFNSSLNKQTTLQVNDSRYSQIGGQALLDSVNLKSGQYEFGLQNGSVGSGFSDINQLMAFERANLGTLSDSKFSNYSLNIGMGKTGHVSGSTYQVSQGASSAMRNLVQFAGPKLNFMIAKRQASADFTGIGQVADPERGLFSTLLGFDQTVSKLSWTISKDLSLSEDGIQQNSLDGKSGNIGHQVMGLNYNRDGLQVGISQVNDENTQASSPIGGASDRTVVVTKQAGNWNFKLTDEQKTVAPNDANPNPGLPESQLQSFNSKSAAVSVKLSQSTTVSSAQSIINFANGMRQTENSNSISTDLTKNMGISVTDTRLAQADSSTNDTVHRDYGFWMNLGHGLVFRYGYTRDLAGPDSASLASMVSLGQSDPNLNPAQLGALKEGSLGGFNLGAAYAVNQTESPNGSASAFRTQAFSNIRVGTAKPMNVGFLKNLTLNFSQDTAADSFNWIRQDKQFGIGTTISGTALGLGYHSQMNQSNQTAIDRTVSFTTDPKQKRFISASIMYKMRTLPNDQQYMIRNYALDFRPTKRLTISNQMITNPDVANGAALLGSVPQASRSNTWALGYASTKDTTLGASWQELVNESAHTYGDTAGLDVTLFKSTSPLHLYFGLERQFGVGATNSLTQRWSIQYDQKVGPNQSFNFFVGDVSYLYTIPTGSLSHNLTARAEYSLRF